MLGKTVIEDKLIMNCEEHCCEAKIICMDRKMENEKEGHSVETIETNVTVKTIDI